MNNKVFKFNVRNIIAMLLCLAMFASTFVTSFGSVIALAASDSDSGTKTVETGKTSDTEGEPTRTIVSNNGSVSGTGKLSDTQADRLFDHVEVRYGSSGLWKQRSVRFRFNHSKAPEWYRGSNADPQWSTLSGTSGDMPAWNVSGGNYTNNSLFDDMGSSCTHWLYLKKTDATDQGYRATCLDPAFNRWTNGAIPVDEADYVVRIDAESESNSSVPLEYKLMRRIIWYSYFGGYGMANNYDSAGYTGDGNKLNAIFGSSAASVRSQYVFLHMAASLISDVSVAKSKVSGCNYSSVYPALGVASDSGHVYNSSITVKPRFANTSGVNANYFPTASNISNLTGAGWNVTYNGGKYTLSSSAQQSIVNYVNNQIKTASAPPEGFVAYVFVSKTSSKYQTFVVYTIETAAKVRVHKQNTSGVNGVSLPSGTNGQGAVYGVYKTYTDAESNTGSVATLTIGNDGYSNIYYHTFAITLFSATPPSVCPTYNLYIKEISPPTSTPDGWAWTLDPTIYTVNTAGWQCGEGSPVVEIPVTTVDSTEKLWPPRYFKLGKVSDDGNISSAGTTFKIYTNSNCTTLATGLQYLNGSTWTDLTWTGSTANGLAVSSSATNGVYYTPVIRVKDVTNSNDVSFYFKEVNKPTANQSNWSSVTYNPASSSGTCGKITVASTNSTQAAAATATAYNHYSIPYGYMRIHKTSNPTTYNNKVNGAKYGIYLDAACTIKATDVRIYNGTTWVECNGVVTISGATASNGGYSPVILVPMEGGSNSRTLYVKEVSAPTTNPSSTLGWVMDPNVYTVTVNAGVHTESQPVMVNSVNTTSSFPRGYMRVKKLVASGITTSPAGAKYGVYASAANAQSDTSRLSTLTIGSTQSNGAWYSGTYSATLTNGLPVTVYVKEVSGPTASLPSGNWVLDDTVYAVTITANHTQTAPVEVVSTNSAAVPKYAALSIFKITAADQQIGDSAVSPEGAQFRVWRVENGTAVVATEVGNNGILTIGADGHSELSWMQYPSNFTGSVTFYFEEITLPTQTVDDDGNTVYWKYTLAQINCRRIPGASNTVYVMGPITGSNTNPYSVTVTPATRSSITDYLVPGGAKYMDPGDPSTWYYGGGTGGYGGSIPLSEIPGLAGMHNGNNKTPWAGLGGFRNDYTGDGLIRFILKKTVPSGTSPDGELYSPEGAVFGIYSTQADAQNDVNRLRTVAIGCNWSSMFIGGNTVHYSDRSAIVALNIGHNYYSGTVDGVTGLWSDIYIKELSGPTQVGSFRWNLDSNVYRMQCYVTTGLTFVMAPNDLEDSTLASLAPELTSHTVNNTWPTNTVTTIRPGYFNIQKSLAAGSGYTGTPNFAGATYGVYTSYLGAATQNDSFLATNIFDSGNNNINGIITLNSSGTAVNGPLHLDIGYDNTDTVTLYVRERTVPTAAPTNYQWLLDPTVYTITVPINRASSPAVVSVEDLLTAKYGYFRLNKERPEGLGGISVSGAQYTVYNSYDPVTGTLSDPATDITKYTGTGTVSNGIITFGSNTTGPLVKVPLNIVGGGASQSGSGTGSGRRDGRAGSDVLLPGSDEQIAMRVLYVKETRLPTTSENASGRLLLDERVYTIIIYADNTTTNPVVVISHEPGELKRQGELMVHKNIIGGPSGLSPAGIQYKVYASANDAERDRNSLGTMTLDADGVSNIVTLDLGYNDEGTYYVKEDLSTLPTVPGYSWTPDTEIHEVVVYAKDIVDEPSTVESDNALESITGSAYISKLVEGNVYDPYDPTGAVYAIYNTRTGAENQDSRDLADDIGDGGFITIQDMSSGGRVIYRSAQFEVPMVSGSTRTLYIREYSLPTYNHDGTDDTSWRWVIDSNVYTLTVTAGGSVAYIRSTNGVEFPNTAYVKVTKSVTGGNISPAGAVYKVYRTQSTSEANGNLLGTLTIDGNGNSTAIAVDIGFNETMTVYVKEASCPAVPSGTNYEWVMDTAWHTVVLSADDNSTVATAYNVESTNSIRYLYGYLYVHKDVPANHSAAGAVYGVFDTQAHAQSATASATVGQGGCLALVTIGANGDSNTVQIPFVNDLNHRTVYVKELSAPTETVDGYAWTMDTVIHEVDVTYQNSPASAAVRVDSADTLRATRGYMYVEKTAPTGYSPEGATYGIYSTQANAANDVRRIATVTIGADGRSEIVAIAFTGTNTSRTVWVRELTAPTQTGDFVWVLDTTPRSITVTDANNPADYAAAAKYTSSNDVDVPQYGYIQIVKTVNGALGLTYDLSGAVYTVYNSDPSQSGATIADDIGDHGQIVINRVVEGGNVYYKSAVIAVRMGDNGYGSSRQIWIKETGLPTDPNVYSGSDIVYTITLDGNAYNRTVTPGNTTVSPILINSVEDITAVDNPVYLKVRKTVPSGFSGQGAVYGVFDTQAHAQSATASAVVGQNGCLALLTIGSDGTSGVYSENLSGLTSKTVYVKELQAPPIPANSNWTWTIDTTVHEATMTISANGTPATALVVSSSDQITYTGGYVRVDKLLSGITTGHDPAGATYKIYTDAACTTPLAGVDDLAITSSGVSNVVFIPFVNGQTLRTVWVKEVSIPTTVYDEFHWELDPVAHEVTVRSTNDFGDPAIVQSDEPYVLPQTGYIKLYKSGTSGSFDVVGAQYTIYTDSECHTVATSLGNNGVVTIEAHGSERYVVIEVPLGYDASRTYYIRETGLPTQDIGPTYAWSWDETTYPAVVTPNNTTDAPVVITSVDNPVPLNNPVYLKVRKAVPTGFNGAGAKYGVYATSSDAENDQNRLATLEIGASGLSNAYVANLSGVDSATYYVKEVEAPSIPAGSNYVWVMDPNVYTAVVTVASNGTDSTAHIVNSTNTIRYTHGFVYVYKTVPSGNIPHDTVTFSPAGAVYGVYGSAADAASGSNPLGTVTIGANGRSEALQIDFLNGADNRHVWVKELSAPVQTSPYFTWDIDDNIYEVTVTYENSPEAAAVRVDSSDGYTLNEFTGYIIIYKSVPAGYSAEGAQYTVYSDSSCTTPVGTIGANGVLTINAQGNTGVIPVALGNALSMELWIRETRVPTTAIPNGRWTQDTETYHITVTADNTSDAPVRVDSSDDVELQRVGYLNVHKSVSNSDLIPIGATYDVYETMADAQAKTNSIHQFTILSNSEGTVWEIDLGYNDSITYYVRETGLPTASSAPGVNYEWEWDNNIYTVTVTSSSTSSTPVMVQSTDSIRYVEGYLKIHKTVPDANVPGTSTPFSPAGATYGVFDTAANANAATASAVVGQGGCLAIVTIDGTGYSDIIDIPFLNGQTQRTVYVKELTGPTQAEAGFRWVIDTNVHEITVTYENAPYSEAAIVHSHNAVEYPNGGALNVHKTAPTGYSPEGATYGVFSTLADAQDKTNVIHTFTIGSNGYGTVWPIDLGYDTSITYYVCELTVPADTDYYVWSLDDQIHTVTITSSSDPDHPVMVESADDVTEIAGYLYVHKEVPTGYQPTGAVYKVYADAACETLLGVADLVIGADGNSNVVLIPFLNGQTQRTVWVKEFSAPTQAEDGFRWTIDTTAHEVTVTAANAPQSGAVRVDSSDNVEYPNSGALNVHKTAPTGFSPEGAVYEVYESMADAQAQTGAVHSFTIGANGYGLAWVVALGYSDSITYYVRELSTPAAPAGVNYVWDIDDNIYTVTVTSASDASTPVMVESSDDIHYTHGHLYVHKDVPTGYSPAGAVYKVYADAACETLLGVADLVIGADGNSQIIEIPFLNGDDHRTVYVKEYSVPTQSGPEFTWNIDTTVYTANVTYANDPESAAFRVGSVNTVTEIPPNSGALNVHKTAPTGFSPEGATYGVFESHADAEALNNPVHVFTIGANGYGTAWAVDLQYTTSHTYYVREMTTPAAPADANYVWDIDDAIYTVTVTSDSDVTTPVMVESSDDIHYTHGYLYVHKDVPEGFVPDTTTPFSPEGAVYGVYDTEAHAQAGDASSVVGQNGCLALLTIGVGGNSQVVEIPFITGQDQRTVYIKEISGPTQAENGFRWELDDTIHTATVTYQNSPASSAVRVDSYDGVELPNTGWLKVRKTFPAGFSPEGATYGVFATMADAQNMSNPVHTFYIDASGNSVAWSVALGYDPSITYYVREMTTPADTEYYTWTIDATIYTVTVDPSDTAAEPELVISNDDIVYIAGYLYVHKDVPSGFSPAGAVYKVYADPECTVLLGVADLIIGADGDSNVVKIPFLNGQTQRTVYVKEFSVPTQTEDGFRWLIDETVYTATVTYENAPASAAFRVGSSDGIERPGTGYLNVHKTAPAGFSPEGAVYEVYESAADAAAGENSVHSFTIGADGYATAWLVDLGYDPSKTYYVKEVSAPTYTSATFDWDLDDEIHIVTVTAESSSSAPVMVDSHDDVSDVKGYLQVHKTAPAGYSPAGAVYKVYTDAACETLLGVADLVIGADGNSQVVEIPFLEGEYDRTVYVLEYSKPVQAEDGFDWVMDTVHHPVTVTYTHTPNAPVMVESENGVSVHHNGELNVHKAVPLGYSPEGAEYSVYETLADAQARENAVHVFEIHADGYATVWSVELGTAASKTYYVVETKAPDETGDFEWTMDEEIHTVTVGIDESVMVESSDEVVLPTYGYLMVQKVVPSGYDPSGAQYTVYDDAACTTVAADVVPTVLTVGSNGLSDMAEVRIGFAESRTVYVKETRLPSNSDTVEWGFDTVVHEVVITTDATPVAPVVVVSNEPLTMSLTVSKTVTGNLGSRDKLFTFTVTIEDLNGTFDTVDQDGTAGTVTFTDGDAVFQLAHGQWLCIYGLPYGSQYTVTETDNDGYTMSSEGATGTLTSARTAAFVNHRSATPPTGVTLTLAGAAVMALGVAGVCGVKLLSRRKDEE